MFAAAAAVARARLTGAKTQAAQDDLYRSGAIAWLADTPGNRCGTGTEKVKSMPSYPNGGRVGKRTKERGRTA